MWKAGDVAEIVNCPWWHHCGERATLLKPIEHDYGPAWVLDLLPLPPANVVTCDEKYFRKPYDGNEVVEWSSCAFQPKVLELVER